MSQLVYKFLPPFFLNKRSRDWVPYLANSKLLFTSANYLNDFYECRLLVDKADCSNVYAEACALMGTNELRRDHFFFSSSGTYSSSSMWARYAADHTGVCLGFKADYAFFSGAADEEIEVTPLRPVTYREYPPPSSHLESMLFTKSMEWAYEQEARMVFRFKSMNGQDAGRSPVLWERLLDANQLELIRRRQHAAESSALDRGILVHIPIDALAEVIIGFHACDTLKKHVFKKSLEHGFKVKFARPSLQSYRIEKDDNDPRAPIKRGARRN